MSNDLTTENNNWKNFSFNLEKYRISEIKNLSHKDVFVFANGGRNIVVHKDEKTIAFISENEIRIERPIMDKTKVLHLGTYNGEIIPKKISLNLPAKISDEPAQNDWKTKHYDQDDLNLYPYKPIQQIPIDGVARIRLLNNVETDIRAIVTGKNRSSDSGKYFTVLKCIDGRVLSIYDTDQSFLAQFLGLDNQKKDEALNEVSNEIFHKKKDEVNDEFKKNLAEKILNLGLVFEQAGGSIRVLKENILDFVSIAVRNNIYIKSKDKKEPRSGLIYGNEINRVIEFMTTLMSIGGKELTREKLSQISIIDFIVEFALNSNLTFYYQNPKDKGSFSDKEFLDKISKIAQPTIESCTTSAIETQQTVKETTSDNTIEETPKNQTEDDYLDCENEFLDSIKQKQNPECSKDEDCLKDYLDWKEHWPEMT